MPDGRINNGGARPGAGRKPGPVKDALTCLLEENWSAEERADVIRALHRNALEGSIASARVLLAYAYGLPLQRIVDETPESEKVIRVEYVDAADTPAA